MAGNRNERPAPSRFPKQRRSNPKNDVCHYFSTGYAKPNNLKKASFSLFSALPRGGDVRTTLEMREIHAGVTRLAKRKKTADVNRRLVNLSLRLAYSPPSSRTSTAR